ncbi:MAG: hypothetical protein EZS28_034411 [Streblomastix strix]|uniref:Uncharacterized protein n=1 Tax=Streblomastix strix TaxID=222440 RepID=A0A5J4UJG2_9EUKA|nr:MAG: hypothetical protein EZS28_034411 [Streblomastix strix]
MVRYQSKQCLKLIQYNGDEQVQTELANNSYGRVICISYCTAGGKGEEYDLGILNGLKHIYWVLKELHEGRTWQPSFQPLPLLARRSVEQIEEEGANEELEAQMKNIGYYGYIKRCSNDAKAEILNHFIHW